MGRVGLAEALRLLREELAAAQDQGQDHQFRFEVTGVGVEFQVELDSEGGLDGKAGFGVVSVGAGGKVSRADTHRLRLTLNIKDAATGSRNLEVSRGGARGWELLNAKSDASKFNKNLITSMRTRSPASPDIAGCGFIPVKP
jgi:Trypsin-co-occurring domain 2